VHPFVKAVALHFAMGYVHPFVDGNGRTARALFYWFMFKRDYWLLEYFPISRILLRAPARHGRAYLFTETDAGDLTYFIHYNLQAILTAMSDFQKYLLHEEQEARMAASLLESYPGLNQRQRLVVHEMLKNPGHIWTYHLHQGKYHVTNPTARADLLGLTALSLLTQTKVGKTVNFRPAPDLRHLLNRSTHPRWKSEAEVPAPIAVTSRPSPEIARLQSLFSKIDDDPEIEMDGETRKRP